MTQSVLRKAVIVVFTLGASLSQAGTLLLHAGDIVHGTLERLDGENLIWNADAFGNIVVPMSLVAQVETVADSAVQSALAAVCEVTEEDGQLLAECLRSAAKELVSTAADPRFEFSGSVDASFENDEDNSDSEEYEFDIRFNLESPRYRHNFRFEHDGETNQERTTDESYELNYQLDRFLTTGPSRWYAYARTSWNKDRFRNPETIRANGAGIGYDWGTGGALNLRVQGGVEHISFSFNDNIDDTDNIDAYHTIIELQYTFERFREITFFHQNEFSRQIGGNNAFLVQTETGFRWPITEGLHAQISLDLDRVDVPQALADDLQENREWTFGLGYRW